jgi:ABC-type antimicrobial peptide transport system permease subunit
VYGVISWAILLMAGMAVALTEMANVRDRNWLFGLARSAGATRAHIAFLVVADAVMLLSAAALTTAAALLAMAPVADSFARSAFDYPLRLTDPAVAPQLALGAVAMLLVGAVLPANRAARLDPVDILERR